MKLPCKNADDNTRRTKSEIIDDRQEPDDRQGPETQKRGAPDPWGVRCRWWGSTGLDLILFVLVGLCAGGLRTCPPHARQPAGLAAVIQQLRCAMMYSRLLVTAFVPPV